MSGSETRKVVKAKLIYAFIDASKEFERETRID